MQLSNAYIVSTIKWGSGVDYILLKIPSQIVQKNMRILLCRVVGELKTSPEA